MASKLPHITVRATVILKAKLQCLAYNHGRSLSKESELILERYIEIYEKKYGTIKLDE